LRRRASRRSTIAIRRIRPVCSARGQPESDLIKLKRICEPTGPRDGARFLVERLWARRVRKKAARLAGWLKDLAPSPGLRPWHEHDPARWPEFQRRYRAEVRAPGKQGRLAEPAAKARPGTVNFVFAASDGERNSAVVLKEVVEGLLRGGGPKHPPPPDRPPRGHPRPGGFRTPRDSRKLRKLGD
jgi:uncharacterized protein YeaO (DUF488 family)